MIDDYIPERLKTEIADYLRTRCETSFFGSAWRRNQSDEDSITAAFFQSLSKDKDRIYAGGHFWEWGIEYSTTSSRGPRPLETVIGADVIFFIEIKLPKRKIYRKGILVQSKIKDNIKRRELEEQVNDMEKYVPNCCVVLGYEQNGFRSVEGLDYLTKKNKRWNTILQDFAISSQTLLWNARMVSKTCIMTSEKMKCGMMISLIAKFYL